MVDVVLPEPRPLSRPRELPWGTGPLRALALRFEVRCNEARLAGRLASLLSSLQAPGDLDHRYELIAGPDGRVEVSLDGRALLHAESRPHALAWLLWHITQTAVEVSQDDLLVHAGSVEGAAGAVVLPAPPNAGKTTLTAALVRAGFGYLTDEVVAISRATNRVLPFPRPLTLEWASLASLIDLDPAASCWRAGWDPGGDTSPGEPVQEWSHIPAESLGPVALGRSFSPRVLVFPRYRPGARTHLEPIGSAEAVLELATNAFNLERHGGRGLRQLAGLAERCSCFRLDVSDLAAACRLVLSVAPKP